MLYSKGETAIGKTAGPGKILKVIRNVMLTKNQNLCCHLCSFSGIPVPGLIPCQLLGFGLFRIVHIRPTCIPFLGKQIEVESTG
ncbi:hypothetical protein IMY05_001G0062200 [Salix suchowensis]|nr:hypothetical protein IMY05_001G0062200 [Salix suchowensis]